MREAVEITKSSVPDYVQHLAIPITPTQEEQFVKLVIDNLHIVPQLNTLLGLEIAVEARLDSISSGQDDGSPFSVESFPSKVSLLVSAFNGVIGQDDRRWALLFDEL